MDATITNTTAERIFIPGPNMDLGPTGDPDGKDVQTWPDITVADLDGNSVLKAYVVAGDVTVSLSDDAEDAAQALQGSMAASGLAVGTFAYITTTLVGYNGRIAFCTNGLKTGEVPAGGTGVPCYYDGASSTWRVFYDDTALAV